MKRNHWLSGIVMVTLVLLWGSPMVYPGDVLDSLAGLELILVKGGCYQMGDTFKDGFGNEKPVHEVCVDNFYLGKTEVTQGQWKAIMGLNSSKFKNGDQYPVENVSWNDAQEFILRLNQKTGKRYRLPTEAEWEYAARSGGKREKWAGTSKESELREYAWNSSNSGSQTHPVGRKKPNALGLYDMSGNVWEWVQDAYSGEAYKQHARNNPIQETGRSRVLRSGSWDSDAKFVRSTLRFWSSPGFRSHDLGFRIAQDRGKR